ncbi:MAG: VCBS repeat-containing protein, partial [Bacteroidales bacterium]|nr:VCBS repeat-containing protein [Bacteroidales bacterium]
SLNSITLMMQSENFSNVGDGATALVDLDLDGFLDVVVIRRNGGTPGYGASTASLFVWNPRTGQMLHTNAISNFPTSTGSGGPGIPLIADMDGDGVPEIGISACNVLRTYKYNKATRTLNQMWSLSTTDGSASTGITLFDFNLDGKSELVYRDQTHLRILDGTTGKDLTKIANSSCTFSEYPVVADVNNDGAAEIIVSGWPSGNCEWRGYICVFSSNPSGRWAPARKVWNQFGYNTVNINEDLTVPRYQFPPASTLTDPSTGITRRPYNCFLQQATVFDRYGVSIHPAAEVFATDIKTVSYDGDSVVVTIKMVNNGSIPLTSPFKITLYKDSSQTEVVYTATIYEEIPVAPEGKTIRFSMPNPKEHLPCEAWVYSINDAGKGIGHKAGLFAECDTTNNKTICHPLVANNDFSTIWKNTQAEILPLTNDVYFCRDIKPEILSSTKHGSFVYNTTTKSYIYTPDVDFWGLDTVKYRLICGKDTAYALIVMTVSEMPDNIIRSSCVLDPDATPWSIKTGHTSSANVHNYAQALCGDIDGDGRNEIVTVGADGGGAHSSAVILILDENLATKNTFTVPTMNVYGGYPVVIADADRDGVGEIYVHCGDGYLYCYDANGNQQWKSDATVLNGARSAVLAIADINNDNVPDILALDGVFNALTGVKEVSLPNIPGASSPYNGVSAMPVMADMDNDGALEVVGGNEVIKVNIVDANNATANTATIWKQWNDGTAAGTGFTSVADIDLDGYLDVVVVRGGLMYAWKPYTGAGSSPVLIGSASSGGSTGGSAGSRALVADIDADGYPEIAWTYANSVQAYEYNPNNKNLVQKWKKSTSDGSGATTMSVFDFNQDGAAEIVYRDETLLRIMDGINGNNITTFSCSSGTAVEYPIIVDLDRDGAAEIVISGNGKMNSFVSKDEQVWAPARYVWNQHGYNVVHVNNDLTIPKMQFNPSTKLAGADGIENTADDVRPYNTFLQQATQLDTTGTPMFLVSDLYADNISTVTHAAQQMTVSLDIHNQGMATAQRPIYIAVYSDSSRQHLLTIDTLKQSIDMNKSLTHSFTINKVDSLIAYNEGLVFDINSRGHGIAHADKLTAECDTMNNRINRPALIAITDSLIVCLKTPAVIIQPLDNDIVDANTTPTLSITARPTKGNASVQGTEIAYTLGKFEGVDSLDYRVVAGADTAFARIYIIESEKVAVAEDIEAEDVFICLNTTAHLAARSHLTGPTFNWYSDSTLKNQLATGETFITPVLNKEVSYWVTVQNADTCENKPLTGKRVNIGFYPNKETQLVDSVCVGATYTKYNFNIYKQNKAGVFTYTQQQQTENGCDSIIKLSLKVIPNPVLDLGEDTVICSGRDHAFVLTAPAGFDGYMWEDYSTQRSRTITEDGTYTLRVRKGICFDTKSKKVEFHEFSFTLGGNRTVCRNDEFLLEPSQGGRTYLWSN